MSARSAEVKTPRSEDGAMPPFWELEALCKAGFDCEAALAMMAAARTSRALICDVPSRFSTTHVQRHMVRFVA